ncbi:hypothetical protein K470DRAFT_205406, partial [Piedraia hortae CBS 480.64]
PRNSTSRTSRDFDARRDGPYGRPSLTMQRRKSSRHGTSTVTSPREEPNEDDVVPTLDELSEPTQTMTATFEPDPPPLNYSLHARKKAIIIFWTLILIDCVVIPIALYFGLWYGTTRKQLSANAVFSIVTAGLGGVSILEYILRLRQLLKKDSTCRPIGAPRGYLDFFHWNFSVGWFFVVIELIVGTIPRHPPMRLLSMPVASMLFAFGTELLIVDFLRIFQYPSPIRISSIPKGSQLRPCIYHIIEDVCAVDGGGGTAFREALNKRYEASHTFRAMLRRLGLFWAFGGEGAAVVVTVIVFTTDKEPAYVVGWAAPFVWAGFWALLTYGYVKYMLKKEKVHWREGVLQK